ncbi:DNA primase [Halorarum halophilum]|uniref:DNA primase DnaG n=1 Tax=Halorarum halophilum TaxID=2743090 RepID=A0A7D5GA35_9EURY|nr:DNA primase DnaG [Halobaculum halophilum]QLG26232.1 DNA primase [Halobaculum halophilum]
MDDSAKYLIHARITADGVVERSDVVGAVFGQTEGLLGDELDLRDLQQSSKVGRIDVHVGSENGQSFGQITISSSLDKVETSILAASLESITRVGPCEARVEVTNIEDMRAAKRREVVERAKELLADSFDESVMDSTEILEEVREAQRVERIGEFEDLPAGPRVRDSDAVVVVEGRADVLTLLKYGVKNAVAVEGTNVPDAVASLSAERTVTAFLDGDRGGELILRELAQVGDVDYVAFAPEGRSVEDLARHEVMAGLRDKVPFDTLELDGVQFDESGAEPSGPGADAGSVAATDGSARPAPDADSRDSGVERTESADGTATPPGPNLSEIDPDGTEGESSATDAPDSEPAVADDAEVDAITEDDVDADADATADDEVADGPTDRGRVDSNGAAAAESAGSTTTLKDHVRGVIRDGSNRARVLDADYGVLADVPAADAFDAVSGVEGRPIALVLDGELSQRVLDVAAQRGVEQIVTETEGEFVKRPTSVRVLTADALSP